MIGISKSETADTRTCDFANTSTDEPQSHFDTGELLSECAERIRVLEASLTSVTQERDTASLQVQAASLFIRDVIEALGQAQPPEYGVVDLPAIALQVVGQIEDYKAQAIAAETSLAEARQALEQMRDEFRAGKLTGIDGRQWDIGVQWVYQQIADRLDAFLSPTREPS